MGKVSQLADGLSSKIVDASSVQISVALNESSVVSNLRLLTKNID